MLSSPAFTCTTSCTSIQCIQASATPVFGMPFGAAAPAACGVCCRGFESPAFRGPEELRSSTDTDTTAVAHSSSPACKQMHVEQWHGGRADAHSSSTLSASRRLQNSSLQYEPGAPAMTIIPREHWHSSWNCLTGSHVKIHPVQGCEWRAVVKDAGIVCCPCHKLTPSLLGRILPACFHPHCCIHLRHCCIHLKPATLAPWSPALHN